MTDPHGSGTAFTLVASRGEGPVAEGLRAAVRRCPHGVLVVSPGLVRPANRSPQHPGSGLVAVLQPCTPDRIATGPALWVGPAEGGDDARTLHRWVTRGAWSLATLPEHLRSSLNRSQWEWLCVTPHSGNGSG